MYRLNNNQQNFYPSAYGNPDMSDVLLKQIQPNQNGGSMHTSDWIKFVPSMLNSLSGGFANPIMSGGILSNTPSNNLYNLFKGL